MKLRHELKYYINKADYLIIKNRIKHVASQDKNADKNGEYMIRSLYFDNYKDKALIEKLTGVNKRSKFRIRFYNNDASFIKLEKKSKINGLCHKVSAPITKEQCEKILKGDIDFLKESEHMLFKELYVKMKTEVLRPKTIVDYIREAYVFEVGNVRITFDKSIKTGITSTDMFDNNLPTIESLDNRYIILEVKFDEFLPEIISDVIQTNERRNSSISKYVLCRAYN
ncbi:polyphosphate polymerase domain-containing protein [Defluviitalea phaphyphila]|uniref:polyphosphate polymerase domain-containing protein n=1 Tax=Defluviitalea phaphyphila TaxID=1473580 RepID=UPI000A60DFF7|nr:polyphosphate polymerase domain-containing protein [Defluviitalea phaphyphila]